jgi:hypothetical protein
VQQRIYDKKEEIVSEGEVCLSVEILIQELQQMFQNLETVKQQIIDLYPNADWRMPFHQSL